MTPELTRLEFDRSVLMYEAQATLQLAYLAVAMTHGGNRLVLMTSYRFVTSERACVIDTTHDVGRALASVFHGYAHRQFGDAAVTVSRTQSLPPGDKTSTQRSGQ